MVINEVQFYIPSIDAKDIYLASHYIENDPDGYNLKLQDGHYNLRKFINSLDFSLDLIELLNIYYKKYRRNDFGFTIKKHKYTTKVINITFKYSVKEWNQMNKNTFVKFGYNYHDLIFQDCIAKNQDGEIVGIILNEDVHRPIEVPKPFKAKEVEIRDKKDKNTFWIHLQYVKQGEPRTIKTNSQLRKELYKTGFICNGTKYCRMKRSTGSARVGKCLFIDEVLFKPILKFSSGTIKPKYGQEIDLAAYESYIALPSSSIIDTLPISPENILVIDDYDSIFRENVVETHDENGWLTTSEKNCEIVNSIWDGQSLMDISLFGDYSDYGMVLLRNLMFKSCCFNCNIQQWFKDNNITDVSQLNGRTRAKRIEDVKLITTPNSIKYLKFDTLDNWLDNLYPNFGVVKHDKKTHFFGGRLVQTHYQLLNTLQMSKDEVSEFLQDSLDFAQMLRDRPEVVRYYIKYPDIEEMKPLKQPMLSKNDVVYNLMCINDNFTETKYYQQFLQDLLRSYYKNLKNGHIYVNGNYSTLLGNPIEMLQHSIGKFEGVSQLGVGNIHSTRFEYNQTLLGSRSPHVTIGNVWLPYNTSSETIDKYLNLTNEIVCINSINENVLQKLSGCDFDSDTVLLTDNKYLIKAAQKNYHLFKTPTSFVSATKVKRYYTPEQQADLDIKTSVNKIGEIINLSQELNSLLWNRMYYGASYDEIKELYYDICQLDIMSGLEIDSAKKEFVINNSKELDKLRQKYEPIFREYEEDENGTLVKGRKKMPHFFSHISRQKGYYNPDKKHYCKYHTTMDYLQTIVNGFKIKNSYKKNWLPFVSILDNSKVRNNRVNQKQINKIYSLLKSHVNECKTIYAMENEAREDKAERVRILKEMLVQDIESETIGFSTLHRLLFSIEDKENVQIKNLLLEILYLCGNDSFKDAIIQSSDEILQLEDDGDDIKLFGIGYRVVKSKVNNSKE
uniref:RNA dependent RNA polymerase n=1 Tax=Siphoviridae sp. ctTC45 TaxID=2827573 RepID=A0A8S5LQE3_9CAUD|nr:MAG TPA: RNA dependent RNA polymerase [Siphoviridae sp. ctTC45]